MGGMEVDEYGKITSASQDVKNGQRRRCSDGELIDETNNDKEIEGLAYLTATAERPSTANLVIQKLQIERVDGGGISIGGLHLGAYCHLTLIIFGGFFLLAGIVLSYVGFASEKNLVSNEANFRGIEAQASKQEAAGNGASPTHAQMKIIGPILSVFGFVMLITGILLSALNRKISKQHKRNQIIQTNIHLSQLEQSFQILEAASNYHTIHTIAPALEHNYPVVSARRESLWIDPTPSEFRESGGTFSPPVDEPYKFSRAVQCPTPGSANRRGSTCETSMARVTSPRVSSPMHDSCVFQTPSYNHDIASFPSESYDSKYHYLNELKHELILQPLQVQKQSKNYDPEFKKTIPAIQVTQDIETVPKLQVILPRHSRYTRSDTQSSRPSTGEWR